ncbi:pre-toxin TG domain-containing protein [Listeria booriae]|uniref:pre-toxin TG domain-containing protein n=1 Tax=Listeria booriae TaxID=1552123 RepID=UPI00162406E4|nr:pre-toxin TG domain-containing protein [Listeria booriae]
MDVKYSNNSWDKSKNALKTLIGLGWGKGVTDYLKDINRNFEDAQNDIRKDDRDGVISFSFTDRESKYQQLFEKIEVLHDYASDAGSMVERVIDEPFYKDIDKFAEKMRDLSIDDYETKNTIGATTIVSTGAYGYGYGQTTTEVPKDSIKLSDIMAGDNFFATNLKAQFAEYSKQNPDQEFTYEQYQSAVSSSRAFEYESIRDGQQNIEFWRDIGIAVVIIATSIVCPPAGLALGIAYGTLELSSAATGKDWLTGREMDAGERATRGAFALLDIIPGVKGLHAFSTATKAGGVALDAVQAGSKLTLKQTAKQGLSNLDAMGKQALRESAERIRNVPRVISDVASSTANAAKNQIKNGAITTGKLADEVTTVAKNLDFGRVRVVADPIGGTHVMFDAAENTHRFENMAKGLFNGSDEVLESAGKHVADIRVGPEDLSALRDKWKVPETDTIAVGKTDVKGLEGKVFEGGSPRVRKEAGLPDLDISMPDRPIKSPGKIASATRHAEEGTLNDFAKSVDELGLRPEEVVGTFNIHQSNIKGVCPTCIQGLNNPDVAPGIFKQFSERFPNLTIKVTSEVVEGVRPVGRLDFVIQNGKYID